MLDVTYGGMMQTAFLNPAGNHQLLAMLDRACARQVVRDRLGVAAAAGTVLLTGKNLYVRSLAAGVLAGAFAEAARYLMHSVQHERAAARLRRHAPLRPEPVLPKPPSLTKSLAQF